MPQISYRYDRIALTAIGYPPTATAIGQTGCEDINSSSRLLNCS